MVADTRWKLIAGCLLIVIIACLYELWVLTGPTIISVYEVFPEVIYLAVIWCIVIILAVLIGDR